MNRFPLTELCEGTTRIVVSQNSVFDPKLKKENIVLADLREPGLITEYISTLEIDINSQTYPGWTTAPEIYINFLIDRSLVFSFGVVLKNLVRSSSWRGDYTIYNAVWFHKWLVDNGVMYFTRDI